MASAIAREKAIKAWKRKWKLELIEKNNPEWLDLYVKLLCHKGMALTEEHLTSL